MMGIALGGIGVISLRVPFTLSYSFLHLLDLPSILLATFIAALFVFVAYFTNPTESSFRTFLTELAFRQHLSRLSEAQDVDPDDYDDDGRQPNCTRLIDHKNTRKHSNQNGHGTSRGHSSASTADTPIVFHFANKASVSLRTPGYQFRSFALFTLAIVSPAEMAIAPVPVPNPTHAHAQPPKPISWNNPSTRGTWFIGAFGKWWIGLELNMQPRQVRLTAQDDAALRERELGRTRGEDVEASSGSRQAEETLASHKPSKSAVPRRTSSAASARTKAALRERLLLQTNSLHKRDAHAHVHTPPPRPTTPPPLPKSASLPLHAKRILPPSPEAQKAKNENGVHHSPPLLPTTTIPDTSVPGRVRALSTHDHSPIIADILKQLDAARNVTSDLHAQLAEFQDASARTHASLQAEVDAARATKKREDAGRAEVKTRTKILDDARRQADGSKREAEKKLKAATAARDGATSRIERLGREVEELQRRMVEDSARVIESRIQADMDRNEISATLAAKRDEIKVAEDVVLALTTRARDLEDKIAEDTAKLQKMKADVEARRNRHASVLPTDMSSWPPPLLTSARSSPQAQLSTHQLPLALETDAARPPVDFRRSPTSPRPSPLVLGGMPNYPLSTVRTNSHSDAAILDAPYVPSTQFRPFADSPVTPLSPPFTGPHSPVGASLIPSRFMQTMENPRSNISNTDSFFSRIPAIRHTVSDDLYLRDESWLPSQASQLDSQRAVRQGRPSSPAREDEPVISKPRRWFAPAAKEKGLNPDAKVFTLPRGRPLSIGSNPGAKTPPTFGAEAFQPQNSPPRVSLAGSFFSSLHNPFAPSPAEREALQRALGSGSGNASLERISSHGSGSGGSGSGSGGGSGAGSHNASPHWMGESRRDTTVSTPRRFFNPWAGSESGK